MADLFLVLSKTIWTFLKPETWVVIAVFAALLCVWRGWRKSALGLLAVLLVGLMSLAIWPLGSLMIRPLEARFPVAPPLPIPPAAILVLGGAEQANTTQMHNLPATGPAGERFMEAITLARRFPEAAVVFTGGTGWFLEGSMSGAEVAQRIFSDAGIDKERMILEGRSRTTWQNAVMTLPLMDRTGDGPVLLLTSAYHMPRSVGVFCAAKWNNLVAWPVDHRDGGVLQNWGWRLAENLETLNIAAKEWVGILAYKMTGRAAPYTQSGGAINCTPPQD
ncbi:YdcF family protein [Rhodobacteraceae bacterium SC52]|nr:YdcF family protein [Rhodobacteraceae bacterium SC52]